MEKAVIVGLIVFILSVPASAVHADSAVMEVGLTIQPGQLSYAYTTKVILPRSFEAPDLTLEWEATKPSLVSMSVGPGQATVIPSLVQQPQGIVDLRGIPSAEPHNEQRAVLSLF